MAEQNDWNRQVIEEFRNNGGKVGGMFEGSPLLLLHTVGARSGQQRVNPLMYLPDGDRWVVFASKAGAPTSPDWYHNLVAHPDVSIEVGTDTVDVSATFAQGDERDQLYSRQASLYPQFAEYEQNTTRKIPVVILTRG